MAVGQVEMPAPAAAAAGGAGVAVDAAAVAAVVVDADDDVGLNFAALSLTKLNLQPAVVAASGMELLSSGAGEGHPLMVVVAVRKSALVCEAPR